MSLKQLFLQCLITFSEKTRKNREASKIMKHSSRILPFAYFLLSLAHSPQIFAQIDIQIDIAALTSPEAAVAGALTTLCSNLQASDTNLTPDQQQLLDVCNRLGAASLSEKENAYRAMSARSATTETTLMLYGPMSQPVVIVDNRLSALRKAAKNATNAGLEFQLNNQPLYANLQNATGGGASADVQSAGRLSGFVSGMYTDSKQDETLTLAGFNGKTYGLLLGADYRFTDTFFAGLAARYSTTDADINRNAGSLDAKDINLTQYGTFYPRPQWYLDWTLELGQGQFDLERNIDFSLGGTTFNETAKGNTDGNHYGASAGGGYELVTPTGIVSQLYGNFRYFKADIDQYTESSGHGLNLRVDGQSIESVVGKLGAQISKALSYSWGVLAPQANLNYLYEFNTDGQSIKASFVSDPLNTQFAFTTEPRDESYFTFAAGVVALFPGGFTAYLQYENYFELKNYSQSVWSLGARMEF
jgi:uncharacterized protein YhjY with autotransporter beta-barrel domain